MLKMIISGCSGHMGRTVADIVSGEKDIEVAAGFDVNTVKREGFPVYADPMEYGGPADVVVDFSTPAALEGLLRYCAGKSLPLVLCTTGYDGGQLEAIRLASEGFPIFKSGNMSAGVSLAADLVRRACAFLGHDFDVEIIERHHRRKIDAPSGTALMLADAARSALPGDTEYVYERQSVRRPRGDREIGISSLRGGTIVGEHAVVFCGRDEVLEIRHSAQSRDIFAAGAVRAARFLARVGKPGLYNMDDLLG